MRIFHIAIPTHDLDAAADFYTTVMHASPARRYDDRVTFRFFDHQIVCHLAPDKIAEKVEMYPRHFGMTFTDGDEFDNFYETCRSSDWPIWHDLFVRFGGLPERHRTFLLCDPSNNLLEFKHYDEARFAY
jgi:uncharacterized protein